MVLYLIAHRFSPQSYISFSVALIFHFILFVENSLRFSSSNCSNNTFYRFHVFQNHYFKIESANMILV
jgi:hypothetical protein